HAFKEQNEFIVVLSGSLDVIVYDGKNEKKFSLNRSYYGLFIPKGFWRYMENFATNTLALVVSSTSFDENDYIRDKVKYKQFIQNENIGI
ncbi:MAG: WxcM-like domain-containing protein, partial [Flavobacteriales bacterium]|nr:WxcM-like domain-containing protein [Flavobacteriales bacterium]